MNDKIKIIPKGSLFTITAGEYSDYYTNALCKAIQNIDVKELQEEYLGLFPKEKEEYEFEISHFMNWLTNIRRYAEEINFIELHTGSYETADFNI